MEEWGFRAGDAVELRGLSRVELNGQRGSVLPLECPEQAKALGRLAVLLEASGKRLSLKVENLVRISSAPQKTGGDLGSEWSAWLNDRGAAAAFPLRMPPANAGRGTRRTLSAAAVSLRGLRCDVRDDEDAARLLAAALALPPSPPACSSTAPAPPPPALPELLAVRETLEGCKLVERCGYSKVVSSAVKAQSLREMSYGRRAEGGEGGEGGGAADRLVVQELYLRQDPDCRWEAIDTGIEQVSSDIELTGGDIGDQQLASRSVAWARIRPRDAPEGPVIFVLCSDLSGGPTEDQFFLHQLAGERARQTERLLEVFERHRHPGDLAVALGAATGAADAAGDDLTSFFEDVVASFHRVMEDAVAAGLRTTTVLEERYREYLDEPRRVLLDRGWTITSASDGGHAWSHATGALPAELATSRGACVTAERRLLPAALWSSGSDEEPCAALTFELDAAAPAGASGPRAGLMELPAIGLGTSFTPEDVEERLSDGDFLKRAAELTEGAVLAALAAGVRLFDSSNKHMNQQVLGRTLWTAAAAGVVARSELFLAGRIARCRDEAEVRREVDQLLQELKVDYVDLLMMDIAPERAPKAWPWIEKIHREGRARFLGVMNFDLLGPKVCTEIFRDFLAGTEVPPAVYAMEVHPLNNNEEMADCCRGLGIQVMAYSPLGAPHKIEAFMKVLTRSDAQDMRPLLKVPDSSVLRDVGMQHGATAAQVALRWNLQRGHCVIPKSFKPEHIEENVNVFRFALSQREMSILAGLHKGVRAERFLQQAHVSGKKALPKMTRDAQDACEAILAKVRGPGSGGAPGAAAEEQMQQELAELYRQQEVLKGKGKGAGAPLMKGGAGKLCPPPGAFVGKGMQWPGGGKGG